MPQDNSITMHEDKNNETVLHNELQSKEDIRYLVVESASIRANPDLEAEVIGYAHFGESYVINEIEAGLNDIEWLKVINKATNENGWISGNTMQGIKDSLNDEETAGKIQQLAGYHPVLEEIELLNRTDDNEGINSFEAHTTIIVSDTLKASVIESLDDPHIEIANKLLYRGSLFDFVFTIENDYVIEITIIKK